MKSKIYSKDIILVLAASFFYMASPMLVTPLITGFSEEYRCLRGADGTGRRHDESGCLCSVVPLPGIWRTESVNISSPLLGGVFMTLACVGYIFAPNEAVVVIARIINGFGFACCSVCMATWMSDMLPKDKIGSGMGFYGTMNALAMAVAPAIGVSAYQTLGYRASFVIALVFFCWQLSR